MNITMDVSEIILYLDLMKKHKKRPSLLELNMMVYYLKNYKQVKKFHNKLKEHKFNPPFKFYNGTLIHFIEDYDDCVNLKNKILETTRRRYSILFIQQILLSKSKEQAISIIREAKDKGINLNEEVWANNFDSMWRIKNDQEVWRNSIRGASEYNRFPEIYEEYCKMKSQYFENISLQQLIQKLQEKKINKNAHKMTQTSVNDRSVLIKEYARRVAKGICQLCDKIAPFIDTQGKPFLEVHHIHYLSKGGRDTMDNVVALCPNCHRRIHHLELEEDIKKIKGKALANINV